MTMLQKEMKEAIGLCHSHKKDFNEELWPALQSVQDKLDQLYDIGVKFEKYLQTQFAVGELPEQNDVLQHRLTKAVTHFAGALQEILTALQSLPASTDSRQVAKEYNDSFKTLCTNVSLKHHLINAFTPGFSVEKFHEARNNFIAPPIAINAYAAANKGTARSMPHPQLHGQLKELRDSICTRTNAPVYMVASGKTLEELVTYLPHTLTDLRRVKGFGKVNTEKYGQQFLDIIVAHFKANGLESNMQQLLPKRERKMESDNKAEAKEPTWKTTVALFAEQKTVEEIARHRNLAVSTIEGHLATAVGHGVINPHVLIPAAKMDKILAENALGGDQSFNNLKQRLGEDYSYFDLKVAMQYKRLLENDSVAETK